MKPQHGSQPSPRLLADTAGMAFIAVHEEFAF